jgi:sec-independent protein translocase protein TatA
MEITPILGIGWPGGPEWMFIVFICLLMFGAKKLPELARGLGRSLGEFKKAREEFEQEIHKAGEEEENRKIKSAASSSEDQSAA